MGCGSKGMASQWLLDQGYGLRVAGCIDGMATQGLGIRELGFGILRIRVWDLAN